MKKLLLLFILLYATNIMAQEKTISGVVTADEGYTLPGVNVLLKGTSVGTVTDLNGAYSIKAASENTLQFSYVGMQSYEVVIGNQTTINVVLQSNAALLQDVVVIGYGTVKKKDLTGSVSQVKAADIAANPGQAA